MQDPEKLKIKKIDSLGAGCGEILMLLERRSNWTKIMGSWRGTLKVMKWIMYGRNGFELSKTAIMFELKCKIN